MNRQLSLSYAIAAAAKDRTRATAVPFIVAQAGGMGSSGSNSGHCQRGTAAWV